MSKHIKLRGKYDPKTKRVCLTLLEITHQEDYTFCDSLNGFCHQQQFVSSNGVRLRVDNSAAGVSNNYKSPSEFRGIFTFYLPRGDRSIQQWNEHFPSATEKEWQELKIAVAEYNEYHKGGG